MNRTTMFQACAGGNKPNLTPRQKIEMARIIQGYKNDPLGFIMWAFPWGVPGTRLAEASPEEWQVWVAETLGQRLRSDAYVTRIGVASGHGIGKAKVLISKVFLHDQERRLSDINPGDKVLDADGKPVEVLAVKDWKDRPCYRVTFDDGSFVDVDENHDWTVKGRQQRRKGDGWVVMSTKDLVAKGVKRPNGKALARQWEIPRQGPAQFRFKPVPVDPYTLGIWLADGSAGSGLITSNDAPAMKRIGAYRRPNTGPYAWYVRGLKPKLREAGVLNCRSWEKHIPKSYKFNSEEVRRNLLAGLLDGDCEIAGSGGVVYTTVSKRLAEDVQWLARSLGMKARFHGPFPSSYKDSDGNLIECREHYKVHITSDVCPCWLKRRRDAWKAPTEERYLKRWIESIEPIGNHDTRCIQVDRPDGLYLTNDFIVTHNSALIAMLVIWFVATHPHPQLITTANTEQQLRNKTWREVAIWLNMSLVSWLFSHHATSLKNREYPSTWFASAVPWSEGNAEAFAGTHEKHVMFLFDEASKIAPTIWETAFGGLTTPGSIMIAFGNPTQNTGYFYDIFGKYRERWITKRVDSRTIKGKFQNPALLEEWINDYGIDSDYCRVRILGQHPQQSSLQFIPGFLVDNAMAYSIPDEELSPLSPKIMSVDVARQGDDHSVILWRKAKKVLNYERFQIPDLMMVAQKVAMAIEDTQPDVCFIDAQGMGAGVYDRLVQLGYSHMVIPVYWGEGAQESKVYINKRVECWARLKAWLKGADLPNDNQLREELISPEFGYERKTERMRLETKPEMKARGLDSPDIADALAVSFAEFVPATKGHPEGAGATEPDY